MIRLTDGIEFSVHGRQELEVVHGNLWQNLSDLPSTRRTNGYQSHASKRFMCPTCYATSFLLVHPSGFDHTCFEYRSDWRHLKYAFHARNADPVRAQVIRDCRGVLWTPLNFLPGWMPGGSAVVDVMHCFFLGLVKHVTKVIIVKHGLLNASSSTNPIELLEEFFEGITWPPEVTRLPPSMAHGKGSIKADQWRNLIAILFVGLFVAWQRHGTDSTIPPDALDAEVAAVAPDRNLSRHYDAILEFSAAIRILTTRRISPADARRGGAALSRAAQTWASMHMPLTPYFHFAQHVEEQIYKYGPTYGSWTYSFERNNAVLARFNHNQHKGGELEATLMRRWWSIMFNYELVRIFVPLSVEYCDLVA
ncbi:hypothetical protein CONPUDRAFT_67407 [Coniophora puteana RWD-64-598 SS2]|uniref:Uncharacterized protein n=1 Tax=Coniophora puteana (strain RWD-64-598) TaxID=741705 RepID=R7SE50_CONPW|nr:uncharacterized protein CONPUDRAFT_67407 [Coniophora puteana RWD-64-598 SS2]EIW74451.1 hypothetical protein CONPUDRAFT_67407 [Coniophora puteana RWD-64-598 SS2]